MTDPQYKDLIDELRVANKKRADLSFLCEDTKDNEKKQQLERELLAAQDIYDTLLANALVFLQEEYDLEEQLAKKIVSGKVYEGQMFLQQSCTYQEYERLLNYKDALGLKLICMIGISNAKG